ncbi:MAG TPA: type I 3-dehydroquinate dehydratase [Chloroflexota bacterium]|nr:type I 3-dehydroquinate dehydratase [Chloroflexota bacterium]
MSNARQARRRMIGVSLGAKTMAEALAALPRIAAEADIAELRLDYFEEPYDLERLLADRPLPVIVTNRPPREGGRCAAPDAERVAVLQRAAALGAEYVDLEWDAATPAALGPIKDAGAQVLVSRHSFAELPADFADWAGQMVERGADVVKIVGMARDVRDALPVFRVFARADRPTIAIAMGEPGLASRVLALRYDTCFLTYATLGSGERVAPGQLPIAEMHAVYRADRLGPRTRVYGILGSRVPTEIVAAQNADFAARGTDAVAVPFLATAPAPEILRAYHELPIAGWRILDEADQTSAVEAVDELGAAARRERKINLVVAESDRLRGEWETNASSPHFSAARV